MENKQSNQGGSGFTPGQIILMVLLGIFLPTFFALSALAGSGFIFKLILFGIIPFGVLVFIADLVKHQRVRRSQVTNQNSQQAQAGYWKSMGKVWISMIPFGVGLTLFILFVSTGSNWFLVALILALFFYGLFIRRRNIRKS